MLAPGRENAIVVGIVERCSHQIERCISRRELGLGRVLHSHFVKTSLILNTFIANRVMELYAKCGSAGLSWLAFEEIPVKNTHSWNTLLASCCQAGQFGSAHALLDQVPEPNIVTYNTMISGLTQHGHHTEALGVFRGMQRECMPGAVADKFTVVGVAGACGGAADLRSLRQLHGAVVAAGTGLNQIMYNRMIDAYGKCGDAESSRRLFDEMGERDVVSWTSMVGAYASTGRLQDARRVLDMIPSPNAVSWTVLIAGYAQHGQGDLALKVFEEMMERGFRPTPFTLVAALGACTSLALIERGKQLHGYIIRRTNEDQLGSNLFVQNALLDMYAKCGDVNSAVILFERMRHRDTISWNSLVTGFAQNGHGERSIACFRQMVGSGVKPNHVTFLGALSACSHAGLVSEGRRLLESMEEHGLPPRPEHYSAIVDLLGRSCQPEEAAEVVKAAAHGGKLGGAGTWGALLGACRMHGDVVELAKRAAEPLFSLEPMNGGRYVMLSNVYAAAGLWEEARRTRKLMKERGLRKEPACSWIEVRSVRHAFMAEDKSHCHTQDIYQILTVVSEHMKDLACLDDILDDLCLNGCLVA